MEIIVENGSLNTGENFSKLLEEAIKQEKREGTVVTGTIVALESDAVLVDVGLKSEGRIPLKEFARQNDDGTESMPKLSVGDKVEVFVERLEGRGGATVLSRERAIKEESWFKFEDLHKQAATVDGRIIGRVKGGFAVDLGGIIAFLPGSQVDVRPIKDISSLVEITQPFKILKMDPDQGNVVVSRRAILEDSRAEARDKWLSGMEEGSVVEGTVKNLTDYGAFIDLGALDGLLHVTDIKWHKINHPSEVLSLGQKVKVVIVKYDKAMKRVSLGMKQLESNPWQGISERYKLGEKFKGTVTLVTDYHAVVELEPGVEGRVYHKQISWNARNAHPRKLLSPGQEVEVKVLEVDEAKHKMNLSIKHCVENPWQKFAETHAIGDVVDGVVSHVAGFGLFVTLNAENPETSIDALMPATELSWTSRPEAELKKYKPGDPIKAAVVTYDVEKERITLSAKQLEKDSFGKEVEGVVPGSVVTCKVIEVKADGITVELTEDLTCFIKKGDLSKHKSEQRPGKFSVGDRVDAKVISFDRAQRKVVLSIRSKEIEEEERAIAEYGAVGSGASLGDILGDALGGANEKRNKEAGK
jgi:small subunit ribosomal protein S1